jgi:hypothetical protein
VTILFLGIFESPCGGGIVMLNFAEDAVRNRSRTRHVRVYGGVLALLLVLNHIVQASTYADDQPREAERDAIRHMNEEIQELQAKVRELEARLNTITVSTPAPAVDIGASAAALSVVTPPPMPTTTSPAQEFREENTVPGVKLRMFGDVGYEASTQKGSPNTYRLGALDLFMSGALTDRVSVLGEVLLAPQANNTVALDLERMLFQYKRNDNFGFAIGRYHTSIGYYNTAFHQGAWFQTAIESPFMYAFDDQGGFLPLQEIGMTINGQIPSGKLGLNYVAEIGNGQSHFPGTDPVQSFQDTNNGKSFNFALFARPSWLPGLQTGVSFYHDHLVLLNDDHQNELISTVHVVYTNYNYEFLNEGLLVRHAGSEAAIPGVFHTPGFYTQFSRRFGKYRPYFRYDYVNAGVAEPIYSDPADGRVVGRRNGPSFGLRYDLNDHSAVKLQYDRHAQRGQQDFNTLKAQFSFAF